MPTLAQALAAPPAPRPERTYELCLDGSIPAAIERLTIEEQTILDAEQVEGPRKLGAGRNPRLAAIKAEVAECLEKLNAQSGSLTVRATPTNGEWQAFVDANPPRPTETPAGKRDQQFAGGIVNVDALVDDLATYAYAWDGDALEPGNWTALAAGLNAGDLRAIATLVITMYEVSLDFQRWRRGLSTALGKSSNSEQPEPSESLPDA